MTTPRFSAAQRQQVAARARKQLGKPYAYGQAGPYGYDCSGSVVAAWKPLLDLPHNSSALVTAHPVRSVHAGAGAVKVDAQGRSATDADHGPLNWPSHWLRLGDLVFYYGDIIHPNTISHVALYVGDGQVVNATGIVNGKNLGVQLIGIDEYTPRRAFGYVAH
jgi:cell wall-associated NlpC family hydrolase